MYLILSPLQIFILAKDIVCVWSSNYNIINKFLYFRIIPYSFEIGNNMWLIHRQKLQLLKFVSISSLMVCRKIGRNRYILEWFTWSLCTNKIQNYREKARLSIIEMELALGEIILFPSVVSLQWLARFHHCKNKHNDVLKHCNGIHFASTSFIIVKSKYRFNKNCR